MIACGSPKICLKALGFTVKNCVEYKKRQILLEKRINVADLVNLIQILPKPTKLQTENNVFLYLTNF